MDSLLCISFLVIFSTKPQPINGGISSLWDFCGCRWNEWQAWEDCNSECNGEQVRERMVWLYKSKDGCPFKFSTCATSDMGYDYRRCNAFCYHGGTSNSYVCACVVGYYGDCCGLEVTCGDPGSISNGNIDGNQFTYGDTIKYNCNTDYMLIDGSLTRTCQLNGLWNGTKPSCAFFNSCSSIPCQNNGNCTNVPDSYTCQCENGWSGTNCEIDVQPPVMSNCSNDMKILTSDLTKSVEWTIPDFTDPHNTSLSITENYVINNWTFPWGDYNISYSALKAVNGHVTECLFEIKIRPFPCQTLSAPLNGALLCNNWKTDYGQYCLYWCQEDYTVARGVDPTSWFICGASGSWFPGASIPDCSVRVSYLQSTSGYKLANVYRNCTEQEVMMQAYYINKLKESEFSYFCNKFHDECTEENTAVLCF